MKTMVESGFERVLFASRWLMAPIYVGLVLALLLLVVVFVRELALRRAAAVHDGPEQAILAVLSLIDLSLAGNLVLIVIFSGYENFVSKIDTDDAATGRDWMGTVDFSGLKMKLIASIVAISGDRPAEMVHGDRRVGAGRPVRPRPAALAGGHPPDLRRLRRAARGDGLDRRPDRPALEPELIGWNW